MGRTVRGFRLRTVTVALLLAAASAGCGEPTSSGRTVINWHTFPDVSGALRQTAANCSRASHGRYVIAYHELPRTADGQRAQLVRRLAAHDSALDILGLDVTWAPEFAEAGWVLPWSGRARRQAVQDTLPAAVRTGTWRGKLYAVPASSNVQLLWYRTDLVRKPPATWAQMLAMAHRLAQQHKPHYVEVQGAQYEGLTVWFNTLVTSAGGSVLTPSANAPALGAAALTAVRIMHDLATSPAADPSLANQLEDHNRLAMENGTAAFELNWPYVYPAMKADNPSLFRRFRWAPYPRVSPGRPAHPTIGGSDLAVSSFSPHPQAAFQAALCLRSRSNQKIAAVKGGLPPSLRSLYHDPAVVAGFPFAAEVLTALESAGLRPQTPFYQNVSIAISHTLSPPAAINPSSAVRRLRSQISDALHSRGLIP
ncbi:ABC transporter substrate-binding protein [Streptomyces sp. NRRL S-1813]|uniref:ABC transporter substrate-binding protein n=1 Tax=Streptomyces sp. NRRL S-1813 TaxID=1463888 RepID=UPI000A990EDB|nr:ABC transporter substrate-binding protein [Streptomyces sp. NRRL S-1813]